MNPVLLLTLTFILFGSYHQFRGRRERKQRNVIAAMVLLAEKLRVTSSLEQAVSMLGRTSDDSWGFFGALGAKVEGGRTTSEAILKMGRTPEHKLFSRIVALYEEHASHGRDVAEQTAQQLEGAARHALDLHHQRVRLRKKTKNPLAVARVMAALVAPATLLTLSLGLDLTIAPALWLFTVLVALAYSGFEWLLHRDATGAVVTALFLVTVQYAVVQYISGLV